MKKRIAIISDVHSNLAALDSVLEDIGKKNIDAIYSLGDIIGYGPQPVECMIKVMKICAEGCMIVGNHDHAVVHDPIGFNEKARRAANWTNSIVQAGLFSFFGGKKKRWKWLQSLPTCFEEGDNLYTHASPRDNLEEYILEEYTKGISYMGEDPEQLLNDNFDVVKKTAFIGHTHRPGVMTEDHEWFSIESLDYKWKINDSKTIINIGSVGQPRDKDPRSCYVIYDGETVEWHRVEYDIDATKKLIYQIPALDNSLADRLYLGR